VTQEVESLLCKHKTLSSNPSLDLGIDWELKVTRINILRDLIERGILFKNRWGI
jgi:hypothetical protein